MINAPWEMACASSMIPGEAGPAERPAPLSGSVTLTLRNTIATTTADDNWDDNCDDNCDDPICDDPICPDRKSIL